MLRTHRLARAAWLGMALAGLCLSGCTSPKEYFYNGFKVGPNYCPPPVPMAQHWIEESDKRVRRDSQDPQWWSVFRDPMLNGIIRMASSQNLTLREAGFRVLQARAQLAVARGDLFPQQQGASGSYRRQEIGLNPPTQGPVSVKRGLSQWNLDFSLAWELDFWGRFRRAVASADDLLQASVFEYDAVLVTLLGDVAANYVQIRTDQERIRLLEENVKVEDDALRVVTERLAGFATDIDVYQARANKAQTQAQIPAVKLDLRQANDRLCVLLGIPAEDLTLPPTAEKPYRIGNGGPPQVPFELLCGIPADLVRRRPDVRRAERLAAAQGEQIGIAQAALYPAFTINGAFGWQAKDLGHLFTEQAFNGNIGPSFQWNLLNYGRIINTVRFQDARFKELVVAYQNTVLVASQEVEDGIATFLRSQERKALLDQSVEALQPAVEGQFKAYSNQAKGDFNRYSTLQLNLTQQQDQRAQTQGQIAQGLIEVYRALGGGWQIRLAPNESAPSPMPPPPAPPPEPIPMPEPLPKPPGEPLVPGNPSPPILPEPELSRTGPRNSAVLTIRDGLGMRAN